MEKWSHIQNRIQNLENELYSLKQEVEHERSKEIQKHEVIETSSSTELPSGIQKQPSHPLPTNIDKQPAVVNEQPVSTVTITEQSEVKKAIQWEKELSQKWLPRVFLFVLIMGFIWGFIAAVDEGWLTPPFRILIGFVVSGVLWFLGEKQLRQNRHNLGISLLAGMVILLTVTTFAMNSLYGYIGFWFTFVLYATWVGIGLWLSARHRSENLAVLVSIGGFFIPMLIDGASNQNEILFYLYEAVLYGIYLVYAAKQRFILLHYVSFFGLHVMTYVYSWITHTNNIYPVLLMWLQQGLLLYLVFFRHHSSNAHHITTLFTSFGLNLLWTVSSWEREESLLLFGIVSLVYIGVACWTWWRKQRDETAYATILATLSIGLATILFLWSDEHSIYTLAIVQMMQAVLAMYIGAKLKNQIQWFIGMVYSFFGLFTVLTASIESLWSIEVAAWVLALGVIFWMNRKQTVASEEDKEWFRPFTRVMIVIWTWVFGTHITLYVVEPYFSEYVVSAIFGMTLVYGIIYYLLGYAKDSLWMSLTGHGFLLASYAFTLQANMYGYEWNMDSKQWNLIHVVLWVSVLLSLVVVYRYPMTTFKQKYKHYALGKHIFTFVLTFVFVTKLTNDLFTNTSYVTQALALSSAWLAYGLVCIVLGRWKKWSAVSVTGMLMLFVVLIKLLFNDVPDISFALRAMLFVALGAIGLGVSRFLYRSEKPKEEPAPKE